MKTFYAKRFIEGATPLVLLAALVTVHYGLL